MKQAWASLFGAVMLALLLGTHLYYPAHPVLARYDFLTLAAVAVQAAMLLSGLETREEAKVILLFHIAGTAMEVFKTSVGSWLYPEPSLLRIGGVPLFTGFMYAAVGSYLARAWRVFDMRFTAHPAMPALLGLAGLIYINFFSHHVLPDIRWLLVAASVVLFRHCWVHYRIYRVHRRMPLLLGLALVSLFIWFAENLGTFAHAWIYPHQVNGWSPVGAQKLVAWYLLMLISYALVAMVSRPAPLVAAGRSAIPGHGGSPGPSPHPAQ